MKIVIGSDHAGFLLKEAIKQYLKNEKDIKVDDVGVPNQDRVNYPEYALKVAEKVASGEADKGILICGSGIGMSMMANKVKGIRAALCYDPYSAIMSRKHNDANILCMGARSLLMENALVVVGLWLRTTFEGGRHQDRIDMMNNYPS